MISETSSAGPGDEILGFHVDKRTWHSVQSVADIAKTANKTIWRICKNRGWITDAEPKMANSEYRLPFEDGEALIDELADAVPEFYIAKRLSARTDVGRSLVDAGILSHIPGTGMGGVDPLVSKASADSFFEILHSKLRFTPNSSRIAIHSVVARTRARLADLIAAIIEDRLAAEITSEGLELSNICLNVADVCSASADPAFVRTTKVARHVKWKSLPSRKKI